MDKQQNLIICLTTEYHHLRKPQQVFELLSEQEHTIQTCHVEQNHQQCFCNIQLSDTWDRITKCELQVKKLCQSLNLPVTFHRSNHQKTTTKPTHIYDLEAISGVDQDITGSLLGFLFPRHFIIHDLNNRIIYNQQGSPMRILTMRMGIPMNHLLSDLHEQLYDFFEDHNVDGKVSIVTGL